MTQMAKHGRKYGAAARSQLIEDPRFAEPCWYAVQAYVGSEIQVQNRLANKGVHAFVPCTWSERRWSDRNKVVYIPLLPGYAFVRIALASHLRLRILETAGVQSFVRFGGIFPAIPEDHIEYLRRLSESNMDVSAVPGILNQGQRVRVRSGILEGIEGVLLTDTACRVISIAIPAIEHSIRVAVAHIELDSI